MLETKRLILRPWEISDAEALYEYARDPRVGPSAGWNPHKDVDESRMVIRDVLSKPETYAVVLKETGMPVGSVGIQLGKCGAESVGNDEAELGCWIGAPYWGRGLIPEAIEALIRYGFEQLGCRILWYAYFDGNESSRRVAEKCGFTPHHRVCDEYFEQIGEKRNVNYSCLTRETWLREHGEC